MGEEEGGEGREDVKGGCGSVTEGGMRGGKGREGKGRCDGRGKEVEVR